MNVLKTITVKLILTLLICLPCFSQQNTIAGNQDLTPAEKKQVITQLTRTLKARYIFPVSADSISRLLIQNQAEGRYNSIGSGPAFAAAITADMQTISHDKHLRLKFSVRPIPEKPENDLMTIPAEQKQAYAVELKNTNYGINKIDVLPGNIGYLAFGFFCAPEFAGDTYSAALNFLAHTDALIIDLRKCRGSASPYAIPFICSYFFQEPVHLNDLHWRTDNRIDQAWTYAYVPGKKYLNKSIYILTSYATFSGAEELAYDLKVLKRATIVGATTAGGANPGGDIRLTNHFSAFVPIGKAVNPVTKTNWENKGVQPDTSVATIHALPIAHRMALKDVSEQVADTIRKQQIEAISNQILQSIKPLVPVQFHLNGFETAKEIYVVGNLNDWTPKANPMQRTNTGWHLSTVSEPGSVVYQFIVDGKWMYDPDNKEQIKNHVEQGSVKIVP